jgi:hypothetical protein
MKFREETPFKSANCLFLFPEWSTMTLLHFNGNDRNSPPFCKPPRRNDFLNQKNFIRKSAHYDR